MKNFQKRQKHWCVSHLVIYSFAMFFFVVSFNCNEKQAGDNKEKSASEKTGVKGSRIENPAYPISDLMGIWTYDPDGPHADFRLTPEYYYVVDYDGDGNMPYQIRRDSIVVYFEGTTMRGQITKARNDTIIIVWDNQEPVVYSRWKN